MRIAVVRDRENFDATSNALAEDYVMCKNCRRKCLSNSAKANLSAAAKIQSIDKLYR